MGKMNYRPMLVLEHRENVMGDRGRSHFPALPPVRRRGNYLAPRKQGASFSPPVRRQGRSTAMATLHGRHFAARAQTRCVSLALLPGLFRAGRKRCVGERFLRKASNELGGIFRALN